MKHALLLVVTLCGGLPLLKAATGVSCESSPAVSDARRDLEQKVEAATFAQGSAIQEQGYHDIVKLDPTDFRPVRQYLQHVQYDLNDQWDALRAKTIADAQAHPEDPVKVLAAVIALEGKDTPEAFRLLNHLVEKQPNFAPAYIQLSGMYSRLGKFIDKAKAAAENAKYFELCPAGRDGYALSNLKKLGSAEQKMQVAKNLRERLSNSTDPHVLSSYSDVWSLEFATLPIAEHPKERQRVLADLTRLEALRVPATAEWLDFLKEGYKQTGESDARVKALEDQLAKEFPHSDQAFDVWYNSWKDQHPQPAGEASAADWQPYMKLALAHYAEVEKRFPQEHGFGYYLIEYAPHLEGESKEDIVREGEAYAKAADLYEGPTAGSRELVARVYLDHGLEPARTLALLKEARVLRNSPHEKVFSEPKDYSKPKDLQDAAQEQAIADANFHVMFLRACRGAGEKAAAEELKTAVDAAPPTDAKVLPSYWNARAVLSEIEGKNTDALTFYQKALFVREPPQKQYGESSDELLADARRVWDASQGSEAAFAIWSQPDKSAATTLAEGRWEKPDKQLPAFALSDLQGKTWKLTSLEGKKVLINIWATWCGPCQSELPHLEKLYEETKGRSDLVILTLNFDEDVGLVEPFVKKKGFTFPVLPAYAFLANKIDVNSIPRNWLVNGNGKWLWEQIGFNSTEPDWEKTMLARLEGTK